MSEMSDIELIRKCAEKMGIEWFGEFGSDEGEIFLDIGPDAVIQYNPLTDDAQAMGLVKRFGLELLDPIVKGEWWVTCYWFVGQNKEQRSQAKNKDLNRAICECVAKLP